MKDKFTYIGAREVLRKQFTSSDSTNPVEADTAVDTLGFDALTFVIAGKFAGSDSAVMNFTVKHSDDNSEFTDAQENQFMVSAPLSYEAPIQKVGYIGGRRYVKLVATMSKALTQNLDITGIAVMEAPAVAPTS